jgi:recombination protein RecT
MTNDRRDGGNQQQRTHTENEVVTLQQRLNYVLGQLEARRGELSAVLPPDIPFDAFHATINQALRNNPDLLDCSSRSLINACVKAAYDGLRVDGREAAIVWEMATVKEPGKPDRREKQARYMPMYQGLVQQVLRGGMVLACEADVIYANDEYDIQRGSSPQIFHRPLLQGDRGEMIAVYNVATLPSGYRVTAYLTREQVIDIASVSKSGWDEKAKQFKGVWKRWPREQWKKTVLRQHRKTLPVGQGVTIRDVEQSDEFPQFDRTAAHPQLAAAPPRPTRQAAALEDRSGTESGVPLDMGHGREGELLEQTVGHQGTQGEQRRQAETVDRDDRGDEAGGAAVDLPANEAEWIGWRLDLEEKLAKQATMEAANRLFADERPRIDASPDRDEIMGIFTDRIAELADAGGDA